MSGVIFILTRLVRSPQKSVREWRSPLHSLWSSPGHIPCTNPAEAKKEKSNERKGKWENKKRIHKESQRPNLTAAFHVLNQALGFCVYLWCFSSSFKPPEVWVQSKSWAAAGFGSCPQKFHVRPGSCGPGTLLGLLLVRETLRCFRNSLFAAQWSKKESEPSCSRSEGLLCLLYEIHSPGQCYLLY